MQGRSWMAALTLTVGLGAGFLPAVAVAGDKDKSGPAEPQAAGKTHTVKLELRIAGLQTMCPVEHHGGASGKARLRRRQRRLGRCDRLAEAGRTHQCQSLFPDESHHEPPLSLRRSIAARTGAYFEQEERMTLMALLLPGVVGGLLLAALMAHLNRRPSSGVVSRSRLEPMSPDLINMAHIKVAGLGGLGMVGAVLVTAIALPQIGVAMIAGVGAGAALAAGLVAYRIRSTFGDAGHDGPPPSLLALEDRGAPVAPRDPRLQRTRFSYLHT